MEREHNETKQAALARLSDHENVFLNVQSRISAGPSVCECWRMFKKTKKANKNWMFL